jgi:hypothetical protein
MVKYRKTKSVKLPLPPPLSVILANAGIQGWRLKLEDKFPFPDQVEDRLYRNDKKR